MVFGKNTTAPAKEIETEGFVDIDEDNQLQSNSSERRPTTEEKDSSKPLLDEVTFVGAGPGKNPGGAKQWMCNHCKVKYTSTYTRIHVHFFGPPLGKKAEIRRCPTILGDRQKYESLLKKFKEAKNAGVAKTLRNSVLLSKHASSKKRIEESLGVLERNVVDMKIIRGLCANGIPFNVLRNPQFLEMINAIKKAPDGYKPPSCEKAWKVLLDECVRDVEKDLSSVKDTWFMQGVLFVSDGWSNVKHKPLTNVLAVNARGTMFMYAEDYSGVEKTGVEISKFLLGAIETIGLSNVLQVVTDNAANYMASEFYWLSNTYKRAKAIVKYFLNHTHALSIFRENSKLELLKVAKTRFASHYVLLRRIMDCREALATTIVLNYWREWVQKGDENSRIIGSKIADTIKDDDFWDDVGNVLAITKPIFLMIKFCDGEGPKMGEVYERMDNMVGEIKDIMKDNVFSSYYPQLEKIIVARWENMTNPLHCLGFALNPRFYDKVYLEKLVPGGIPRKAPNQDKEVVLGVMEAFKRIFENEREERVLREQFVTFHMKKGIYSMVPTQADAVTMDVIDWWSSYGAETPELAEVAKKVLSQPISSSSAERNWSTYSYIHNVKRNRLNCKGADKLVFIHSNIRLQSCFSDSYKSGPHKNWDIDLESTYIEGSSAQLEEMVWENLDEEDMDNGKGKRPRLD